VNYVIEFVQPGLDFASNGRDLVASFEADSPFLSVHAGDLLRPASWPGQNLPSSTQWRVLKVEHILVRGDDEHHVSTHKLVVYSREEKAGN